MWKWHGFSLSTALTWQSRIRTGGLSCIGRPRGVTLISHGFSESPGNAAAQDKDGSTPLHRASQRGELVLAWFLIENGADAAAQDNCGWTPLRWASRRGDLDLARLLVEHGANAAAQDEDGWTPLSGASEAVFLPCGPSPVLRAARLLIHSLGMTCQSEDSKLLNEIQVFYAPKAAERRRRFCGVCSSMLPRASFLCQERSCAEAARPRGFQEDGRLSSWNSSCMALT